MMAVATYDTRRRELEAYFDRTAVEAWKKLTSDAPVGRIRATVRAGRDSMRNTILSWLPDDLRGARILDAGCGTGALSVEAAQRGAHVVAIDVAGTLVDLARDRMPAFAEGSIDFRVGDMLDPALGRFDHIVAMDSLIHYEPADVVRVLGQLAARCNRSMVVTFAPATPLLQAMHKIGKLFPRSDRSPAIVPVREAALHKAIARSPELAGWRVGRTARVARGFYISQALEVTR